MIYDMHKIKFLDLLIVQEGNGLHMNLYNKPTDCNTTDSCHPLPLKDSLSFTSFVEQNTYAKRPQISKSILKH